MTPEDFRKAHEAQRKSEPTIAQLYEELAERLHGLGTTPITSYLSQNQSLRAYDLLRDSHTHYQAHLRTSAAERLVNKLADTGEKE